MESMDLVDSDASAIPVEARAGDVSSSYAASYLESFLPAYEKVNQSADISGVADRYRAIRFAADASLALVASGANWSDALGKMLVDVSERNELSNEGEFLRSSESGLSSSEASISSRESSPHLDSNDLCEPSASTETVSWGRKLRADPLSHRNGLPGRSMSVLQRFAGRTGARNWSRSQRHSRDAGRLAILTSLSRKCRSKRRLLRRSLKPRAVVRKVKSLAKNRRRVSVVVPVKPVECPVIEPEQRFENGLLALQRLVPGGTNMDADVLLDEAADFVVFLKLQVQALQSVANAVGIDS